MDPAIALVLELRDAGMTVELEDEHIIVAPRERITEQLRGRVRRHRQELIDQLRLEQRIRAMAERWGYTAEELDEELIRAAAGPAKSLLWVERDERVYGQCVTSDDFALAYENARQAVLNER